MSVLIGARFMKLDVGGKGSRIPVGNDMTEEKMNRILIVGKAYLQQYVYVEMVLTECFMMVIENSLQKKKCFKFEVKKSWKECKKSLKGTIRNYDSYVPNSDFNNEYALTYFDNIKDDLNKLRDKLATRFKNLGYEDKAGLYANCIVLYNLMTMCVNTYEAIMTRLKERLGVNLIDVYLDFCPLKAFLKSYDFMKLVMGKDFEKMADHVVSKDVVAYFEKVRDGFFSEKTMDEAAKNATEEMSEREKELQRKYIDIDDVMSSDFPIDLVKKKKASQS